MTSQQQADLLLAEHQASRGRSTMNSYSEWLSEVRALFPESEEFYLAQEIYPFAAAYHAGMSPRRAYDDFDFWTMEERAEVFAS